MTDARVPHHPVHSMEGTINGSVSGALPGTSEGPIAGAPPGATATLAPPRPDTLRRGARRRSNVAPSPQGNPTRSPRLKHALVALDAVALTIAWTVGFGVPAATPGDTARAVLGVVLVVTFGIALARNQSLYRARACAIPSEERARLLRVAVAASVLAVALRSLFDLPATPGQVAIGAASTLVFLIVVRAGFRRWVARARGAGRYVRPVVVAGDDEEAQHVVRVLREQPELGFRVVGYLGRPPSEHEEPVPVPWLGSSDEAGEVVARTGATGVIVVATALGPRELNRLVRVLHAHGAHVHYAPGIHGLTHRRLRPQPLSHEPFFYVEPAAASTATLVVKRAIDVVLASVLLVLTAPLLEICALAIKLGDGGPVFFRQLRVGRHGECFRVVKLRTMVPDAERRLHTVLDRNTRDGSPLFKDPGDPRRTRVGRLLEATSIDELPQLWNVLRGDMSLVGPRPALPHEVATFDDELLERHRVRPGITGLWQVEGRDNPHFGLYRRLDLLYVDNLSIALDIAVMMLTVQMILVRAGCLLLGRDSRACHAAARGASREHRVRDHQGE